ncbi:hypothetical protein BGZ98_003508 [Dissophora globulifera]|nr:hypothetical protein BGZ98_003508 [Dissophora globulifera]
MAIAVNSIAIASRMFDIYYVQPWTGVPGKLCRSQFSDKPALPLDPIARAKKDLDLDSDDPTSDCPDAASDVKQAGNADRFLMWNTERLKLELWAPLRKISQPRAATANNTTTAASTPTTASAPKPAPTQMSWRGLMVRFILYSILADVDIFLLSFYTNADLQGLTIPQTILFIHAFAIFIMVHMFGLCFSVAIIYCITTGQMITTSEWAMIDNKLPCFALTPAEFWVTWHTLFRFLWVDLGYLPSKRFCERRFGPERVGYRVAKLIKETLPVFAVFSLSAVLHAYLVQAVWRESFWGQFVYFFFQAVAVMLTKAVERSSFGRMVLKTYDAGGWKVRTAMQAVAMVMMIAFHLATVPMFIEPYKRNNMWLTVKKRSVLWWMFGK